MQIPSKIETGISSKNIKSTNTDTNFAGIWNYMNIKFQSLEEEREFNQLNGKRHWSRTGLTASSEEQTTSTERGI